MSNGGKVPGLREVLKMKMKSKSKIRKLMAEKCLISFRSFLYFIRCYKSSSVLLINQKLFAPCDILFLTHILSLPTPILPFMSPSLPLSFTLFSCSAVSLTISHSLSHTLSVQPFLLHALPLFRPLDPLPSLSSSLKSKEMKKLPS